MVTGLINIIATPNNQSIDWAGWLTALSTLAMTTIAWRALNTWKDELKLQKKISVLTNIETIFNDLERFLHDYYMYHCLPVELRKTFANMPAIEAKKINETNDNINLLIKEAKIIKHKKLVKVLEYMKENVKEYFPLTNTNKQGDIIYTYIKFGSKYVQEEAFRKDLANACKEIRGICQSEFEKIYS